jgi:hypothetical protein
VPSQRIAWALIEAETRKQFGEFRAEIPRRSERQNRVPPQ